MSSGVKVSKACTDIYDELKMKKMHRYIIFRMSDNKKEIIPECTGERDATYEELKSKLTEAASNGDCRYAVFDCHYDFKGQKKEKLMFIAWSPENAVTKSKMLYTSSKEYLKKALRLTAEVQATDDEELSYENLLEKAKKHDRE